MRQEFYAIYQSLSDSYEKSSSLFPLRYPVRRGDVPPDFVRECIREGLKESMGQPIRLRPDGEHFLITNFSEMFVLPALHPQNQNHISLTEIHDAIVHDVTALMAEVIRLQAEREEITGEDILRAAAGIVDNLKINQFRFWGASERGYE